MTLPSPEPTEQSLGSQGRIDFSKPPLSILEYQLGNPVSRENFTHFIIDSFAKSQGNPDMQTYYWMWIQQNTGQNLNGIIHGFIDSHGVDALTGEEQDTIKKYFDRVSLHKTRSHQYPEADSFNSTVARELENGLSIWEHPGELWKRGTTEYIIQKPDENVLRLGKSQFEEWLRTNTSHGLLKEIILPG